MIFISKNNIIVKHMEVWSTDFKAELYFKMMKYEYHSARFCKHNADKVSRARARILCQSREKYIVKMFLAFQR